VFLASGNVRLEMPARGTYLEADDFHFDQESGLGIATLARVSTTVSQARDIQLSLDSMRNVRPPLTDLGDSDGRVRDFERAPFHFRAETLFIYGFDFFEGQGVEFTSCDYGVPHFSIASKTVDIFPVGSRPEDARARIAARDAQGTGTHGPHGTGTHGPHGGGATVPQASSGRTLQEMEDDTLKRDYIVDPESSLLRLGGSPIIPVPISHWDTRWNDFAIIRSVEVGDSSQFGAFGGVDWNLNTFLRYLSFGQVPVLGELERDTRLGFETTYMDKRGFGWGPNAEYGEKPRQWEPWQLQLNSWNYYGQAQYFGIHDRGDEDRSTRLAVPREDRYWGHIWHRQAVPHLGLLDFEYSNLSDRAFLGEYFESVEKEGKPQENLIYWRRNLRDNMAATGLYEFRIDDFVTETERLPEGKVFLFQEPVWKTGLYTDLELQAAQLRLRPDNDLGQDTRDFDRYDLASQVAYPIGLAPYLQLRPFGFTRLTHYGEVADPDEGSEDRITFGAGVTASQTWSRVFQPEKGSFVRNWLDAPYVKHNIVPRVSYLNVFANNLAPDETLPIDFTDEVDKVESVAFSLTNEILARIPSELSPRLVKPILGNGEETLESQRFTTQRVLESEVSFVLFPQSGRDNDSDLSSLLILDNSAQILPRLAARLYVELNPNRDFRGERISSSLTYDLVPGRLNMTIGDRLTREQIHQVFVAGQANLTDKWSFDAYYARDFEEQRDVEYYFALSRKFHRFVLSIEYEEDVGEDRDRTVLVNFTPLEVFQGRRQTRNRRW